MQFFYSIFMRITLKHWFTLFVLSLVWGSSFILIKQGLVYFTPFQVGALRITFAGLFTLPISLRYRQSLPKKDFPWLLLTAVVGSFIPMFLFPIAEVHLDSAIAGILNALMSIFVIVLGVVFFKYKTSKGEVLGILLAFFGVVFLLSNGQNGVAIGETWIYHAILIIAAIMYAYSGLLTEKYMKNIPPLVWTAFIESVLLIPALIVLYLTGFFSVLQSTPDALYGVGFVILLALFGSVLANIFYYALIKETNANFASSVSLLMPIVALCWGLLVGESLALHHLVGAFLIIVGLYFGRKQ